MEYVNLDDSFSRSGTNSTDWLFPWTEFNQALRFYFCIWLFVPMEHHLNTGNLNLYGLSNTFEGVVKLADLLLCFTTPC